MNNKKLFTVLVIVLIAVPCFVLGGFYIASFTSPKTPNSSASNPVYHAVTFDLNGGKWAEETNVQLVKHNETAKRPETNPTRGAVSSINANRFEIVKAFEPTDTIATAIIRWSFVDWSTSKDSLERFDFDTKITGNITLYAYWKDNFTTQISTNPAEILDTTVSR